VVQFSRDITSANYAEITGYGLIGSVRSEKLLTPSTTYKTDGDPSKSLEYSRPQQTPKLFSITWRILHVICQRTISTARYRPPVMYEKILGRIDAWSASLGLARESQHVRPGENPWAYSGGTKEETSLKGGIAEDLHKKETESDVESVESTFKMVEKTEVEHM
jgi:hypothetical protein